MASSARYAWDFTLEIHIFWGAGDVYVLKKCPVSVISYQSGCLYDALIGKSEGVSMGVSILPITSEGLHPKVLHCNAGSNKICRLGSKCANPGNQSCWATCRWRWSSKGGRHWLWICLGQIWPCCMCLNLWETSLLIASQTVVRILQPVMWISSVNIQCYGLHPIL